MQSINVQCSIMAFLNKCAETSNVSAMDVLRESAHIPNWQPIVKSKLQRPSPVLGQLGHLQPQQSNATTNNYSNKDTALKLPACTEHKTWP